jgi:hypothetical protein
MLIRNLALIVLYAHEIVFNPLIHSLIIGIASMETTLEQDEIDKLNNIFRHLNNTL